MDIVQSFLNLVVPPLGLLTLVLSWPMLTMISVTQWFVGHVWKENVGGKVILITGASSGIGEHVAYQYAKLRAILVLVARREENLKVVAERARNLGAMDVRVIAADVSKEEDCKRFIDETINQYGHLDHLVNNAGIAHSFLFEEATDTSALIPLMDINFWGNVYPTYYGLPHLKRTKGKIIVNASVAAWLPLPRMGIYNAAKAAVFNFYDTLRIELGPSVGITIVTPGWIESEMTKGKFVSAEGEVMMREDQRDLQVGPFPVAYAEECAKAMVSGALRGLRYVRIPYWYTVFLLYRVFAPELLDWSYRLVYIKKAPILEQPLSKAIMDMSVAKKIFYPTTIQKTE